MRFHFGKIPESPDFTPDKDGWRPLREPEVKMYVFYGSLIGLAMAALFAVLWVDRAPVDAEDLLAPTLSLLVMLAGLVVVHEMLHAIVFPQFGFSSRTTLGLWLRAGIFYAHFDGETSRNRFAVMFLMPFMIVSVLPLGIAVLGMAVSDWVAAVSTWNALFAGADLMGACMLLWQVPPAAAVRNQGWKTYWKTR